VEANRQGELGVRRDGGGRRVLCARARELRDALASLGADLDAIAQRHASAHVHIYTFAHGNADLDAHTNRNADPHANAHSDALADALTVARRTRDRSIYDSTRAHGDGARASQPTLHGVGYDRKSCADLGL